MCRLFAQLSPIPADARRFLVDSRFSLLKQSDFDGANRQADGWGLGWFGNKSEPMVSKSPKPAFKEKERFEQAAAQAVSRVVIGHLRAASNPRGVPRARLINMDNTQPFTDGRFLFAHNGTLEIPDEVAARLGPLRKKLKSLNDSEVYFYQFLKFYREHRDGPKAFESCVRETWALWERCKDRHPKKATPYTSLNALASDGDSLFAFCHNVRKGLAECGVCNPTQPWAVMSFSRREKSLAVASENMDDGDWTRFDTPEVLVASAGPRGIKLSRQRYELAHGALSPKAQAEAIVG